MERNVHSFGVAIRNGQEPSLYTYDSDQIPKGTYEALLDFKTWSKRILAINCYFTKMLTHEKFVVTVYCDHTTSRFIIDGSTINFSNCAIGVVYHIEVAKNSKGRVVLVKALISAD